MATKVLKGFAGLYVTGVPVNGVYQTYLYLRDCPGSTTSDYEQMRNNFWQGLKEGWKWPYLVYERVSLAQD